MNNQDSQIEAETVALCDRLCLNNEIYQSYVADPRSIVGKYVTDRSIHAAVQAEVTKRLDNARLQSHWVNSIACACRDVAYQIPD